MPKPAAKPRHQPIPELAAALALPARERAGRSNSHRKTRRETAADYIAAIKAAAHTK